MGCCLGGILGFYLSLALLALPAFLGSIYPPLALVAGGLLFLAADEGASRMDGDGERGFIDALLAVPVFFWGI